jgi:hypothetical protein
MDPGLALSLHKSSHLTSIYYVGNAVDMTDLGLFDRLDAVQDCGTRIGPVSSTCRGGAELLYARFYTPWTEDGHDPFVDDGSSSSAERRYVRDSSDSRNWVYRSFRRLDTADWRAFTDFEGLAVPLTLIERMREVEGASEEEWQGRGVQVGEAA